MARAHCNGLEGHAFEEDRSTLLPSPEQVRHTTDSHAMASCVTVLAGGRAIYASGSPQEDVTMNGKKIASSQVGTSISACL